MDGWGWLGNRVCKTCIALSLVGYSLALMMNAIHTMTFLRNTHISCNIHLSALFPPPPSPPHAFKTGTFRSLHPLHPGLVLLCSAPLANCASSIADAHRTNAASLHAVPISASPNGIPLTAFTPAGSVTIGYPACAAIWYVCPTSGGTSSASSFVPLAKEFSAASMPSSRVLRWQKARAWW